MVLFRGKIFSLAVVSAFVGACSTQPVRTTSAPREPISTDPYVIDSGDTVDIEVWKEPALCGKVNVAPDGTLTIPLVGHVPAAGKTADQVQNDIRERLSHFVADPNVTARVTDQPSMIFYMAGEVKKPGVFTLHKGEVLSQAVAEAGGFSDFADQSAIRIVRRRPTEVVTLTVDYRAVAKGKDDQADIPLERGDTVFVP